MRQGAGGRINSFMLRPGCVLSVEKGSAASRGRRPSQPPGSGGRKLPFSAFPSKEGGPPEGGTDGTVGSAADRVLQLLVGFVALFSGAGGLVQFLREGVAVNRRKAGGNQREAVVIWTGNRQRRKEG